MFGKVKKWLGIEGVKAELILPEMAFEQLGVVIGKIRFHSKNTQAVHSVRVRLIERYQRGRGKDQLTDEYVCGEISINKKIVIPADQPVETDFILPFRMQKSGIDKFAERNLLNSGLAYLAKKISNVRSEFRVEAEAQVEGTILNPFVKKNIEIKKGQIVRNFGK